MLIVLTKVHGKYFEVTKLIVGKGKRSIQLLVLGQTLQKEYHKDQYSDLFFSTYYAIYFSFLKRKTFVAASIALLRMGVIKILNNS